MGSFGFNDLFSTLFGGPSLPPATGAYQNILNDWLRRGGLQQSGAKWGPGGQDVIGALNNVFDTTNTAIQKGTPFYESLIPSAPGTLSPAAAAQKAAATDALQSSLGSAGVSQLGQLGREYGGRLPASLVQSGLGSLARAGAGGATDIARQAVESNVGLGEQGVQGLAGLSSLSGQPLNVLGGGLGAATSGMYNNPGAINAVVNTAKNVASGVAGGLAGFGGLGGGGGAGATSMGGLPSGGLPTAPNFGFGTISPLMTNTTRQYLPTGAG